MRWRAGLGMIVIAGAAVTAIPRIGHSGPDQPVWRISIPGSGSGEGSSTDVVTKVLADSEKSVHFVQATSDGLYREVVIRWTPSVDSKGAGDVAVTLDNGRQAFVRNLMGTPSDDGLGYKIAFDFYLPAGSVSNRMGRLDPRSNQPLLSAVKRLLESAIASSAWAAGPQGWSGSLTDSKTYVKEVEARRFREVLRQQEIHEGRARVEACLQYEVKRAQDWLKRLQQWQAEMNSSGLKGKAGSEIGDNPEHAELKSQWTQLYAEAQEADARAYWKSIPQEARDKYSKGKTAGVDALMAKDQIELDKQALKDRIAALRKCHENPTAPTAVRAKQEGDPARKQISEALDAVELQVEIDSGFREAAALLNSAAGSELGPLGLGATTTLGQIEDRMLKNSMEEAVASLEKCIVRCCDEQKTNSQNSAMASAINHAPGSEVNYTPGPDQNYTPGSNAASGSEPNYTPGPDQNYTPGPRGKSTTSGANRPQSPPAGPVCGPPVLEGQLIHTENSSIWVVPNVMLVKHATQTMINARLTPVPGEPGHFSDAGSTFIFRGMDAYLQITEECTLYGEARGAESGNYSSDADAAATGEINDDGQLTLTITAPIHPRNIHNRVEGCQIAGQDHSDSFMATFESGCWGDPIRPGQSGYVQGRKSYRFNCRDQYWSATGVLSQAQ